MLLDGSLTIPHTHTHSHTRAHTHSLALPLPLKVASGAALLVAQGLDDEYAPAAVQFTASASPLENMTASAGGALPVSGKLLQLILPAGFARGAPTSKAADAQRESGGRERERRKKKREREREREEST